MSLIFRKSKHLKQTITKETSKELLRINNQYGRTIIDYL
jgi:hypothetical protein